MELSACMAAIVSKIRHRRDFVARRVSELSRHRVLLCMIIVEEFFSSCVIESLAARIRCAAFFTECFLVENNSIKAGKCVRLCWTNQTRLYFYKKISANEYSVSKI
jgi:hypothetical protein